MSRRAHRLVDELTPAEGRFLCGVLYRSLVDTPPVSNHELTDYLDVSGASVTGMSKALADEGLLTHERYHGVELTERGNRIARALLWRRCAIQEFFEDELGFVPPDDQAYRIAIELDTEQVDTLGSRVTLPCDDHCEAADRADCELL